MSVNLDWRDARAEDAVRVINDLRQADIEEIGAHGSSVGAVLDSICDSLDRTYVVVEADSDAAIFIFGISEDGYIWGLGTDEIEDFKYEFASRSEEILDHVEAFHEHEVTWTIAYAKNRRHMQWLRYVGFEAISHDLVPPPFQYMERTRCVFPQPQ